MDNKNMMQKAQKWLRQEKTGLDYSFYKSLLNKLLDLIKNNYDDRLISLVLYGSVARGTAKKDSDIDIIIITDNLSHTDSMDRFLLIEEKLKESPEYITIIKSGCFPELKPILFSQEVASESRYIFLDIVNDGIILYDINEFFKKRLDKLRLKLKELKSKRIFQMDGSWYWILAPNLRFGGSFEI